jgi:NAD(P)-dependent dehydrogenase (short-subunit alcohol dehydrogenase family)
MIRFDFSGYVALVTGAGAGVGRAASLAFAVAGASVICVGRTSAKLDQLVAEIKASGGRAIAVAGDVVDEDTSIRAVSAALDQFGRLDFAYNGAGREAAMTSIADTNAEAFWEMQKIKTGGCLYGMKHQIPAIRRQGGAIVNMAGSFALEGFANFGSYVSAAHAVLGLTRTAALEEGRNGIRVNAVCPGAINTALLDRMVGGDRNAISSFAAATALGKIATPEDVANAILFLCSSASGQITGAAIRPSVCAPALSPAPQAGPSQRFAAFQSRSASAPSVATADHISHRTGCHRLESL